MTAQRSPDNNVEALRDELLRRSVVGLTKYGTTTQRRDLSAVQWAQHQKEELLDAAVYTQAIMERVQDLEALFKLLRSYNPALAMGDGMREQFLALRERLELEPSRDSLQP